MSQTLWVQTSVWWCTHCCGIIQRSGITLNVLCALPMCLSLFLPDSLIRKPLVLLLSLQPSQERHILRIIQWYIQWIIQMNFFHLVMHLSFFRVFPWPCSSFPFSAELYYTDWYSRHINLKKNKAPREQTYCALSLPLGVAVKPGQHAWSSYLRTLRSKL